MHVLANVIDPNSPNVVICSFDYLDEGDGAVIELLHIDEERYPEVRGTMRGVPKGILDWGSILRIGTIRTFNFPFNIRNMYLLMFAVGIIMTAVAYFSPMIEWALVIFGLFYTFISLFALFTTRRRFPKSLMIEDIKG